MQNRSVLIIMETLFPQILILYIWPANLSNEEFVGVHIEIKMESSIIGFTDHKVIIHQGAS